MIFEVNLVVWMAGRQKTHATSSGQQPTAGCVRQEANQAEPKLTEILCCLPAVPLETDKSNRD